MGQPAFAGFLEGRISEMNTYPFEAAKWIGGDAGTGSPIIIRRFYGKQVKKATLFVTGLGYFEAKINELSVTDARFIPVVSDYESRNLNKFTYPLPNDETTHSVYYYEYDITNLLQEGDNVLTIQLGGGFYRQKERVDEGIVDFGDILKTIYKLELKTNQETIFLYSDGTETWKQSEILSHNLFLGEVIDPSVVSEEKPVQILPDIDTEFRKAIGSVDRVIRKIEPKILGKNGTKTVFDAGENISGVVKVHTSAAKGEKITLRFAENIREDLSLDFDSTGGWNNCSCGRKQIMEDVFIADGIERPFEPKFVWHAFRYFEVEGKIDKAEVLVIHSDTPVTATFECSSEGVQFLYNTYLRTQLDNMHGSIPSDCPHRERLGYTGDGQVCAPTAMMLLDSKEFYKKWIQDILDCQDKENGHVHHTAPLMGGGGGPGGWGCAIVLVPYAYYKQYGDVSMLSHTYEGMRLWIEYLKNHSENGLVIREEEKGWCLGDWCTLDKAVIPEAYVNSCYLLKCLHLLAEIAWVLEKEQDRLEYKALIETVSRAIRKTYYDERTGQYCAGVQGANAYAIWAKLAAGTEAEKLAAGLAAFYDALGHFDTGFLATDILMEVLMDYGYADTALKLLESEDMGSFLYMKRHGATTLWESWHGGDSHNHPMFGACARQLFTGFLGIRQPEGSYGYEKVEIMPRIPQDMEYAKGSIDTTKGRISVCWYKENGEIKLKVNVPADVKIERTI